MGDEDHGKLLEEIAALRQKLECLEEKARIAQSSSQEGESVRKLIASSQHMNLNLTQFTLEHFSDAAFWIRKDASIVYVNETATRMLGYSKAELLQMSIYDLDANIPPGAWPKLWEMLQVEKRRTFESRHHAKDGTRIAVEIVANYMEFEGHAFSCAFARDIRERQQMEVRLRQAEKMEAIGQLAGGIAHDYNNQLMGIMGYADLLRGELDGNDELCGLLDKILLSVTRSAELTAQLLAFSRKGKYVTEPVELHQVVQEVASILKHSIDKRIQIRQSLTARVSTTLGDSSQLQSAILNLALNARDAMPDGGTLVFSSENVELTADFQSELAFPVTPGEYVKIGVADTGTGISPEIRARIFEPFFTTKEKGKGTGLGLAAVYGTVKNHRGAIRIHSEKGYTELSLFLPVSEELVPEPRLQERESKGVRRPAHIMVVEDEPLLRDVARRMLESLGYSVVTFESGDHAVNYFRGSHAKVDLVILDMVMPIMNGRETYRQLRVIRPDVRALLASGYSLDGDAQAILDDGVLGFIQKPYGRAALDERVASALAAPRRGV